MPGFVVQGPLRAGVPMVELELIATIDPIAGESDRYRLTGIIDTGSPACIVNVGVLPDYFFQDEITGDFVTFAGLFGGCRGSHMGLWFREQWKDAFRIPVYEKRLGIYGPGDPFILLGRSFLNFGTLKYDGPKQQFSWSYETQ